jgi:hypothetical protein
MFQKLRDHYEGKEMSVRDMTSLLRTELNVAKKEAKLYRRTLSEKEKLEEELANLNLELARMSAIKSQKDQDCKAAEEAR